MKKRVLISLASAALLSVGAVGIGHVQGADAPQTVQAAKKAKAFKVKLTKNAVVYSSRGKRKTKKTLKKGHVYPAYGKKTIRGKKYYKLSHGRYIKVNTASFIVEESNPTPIKPDNTNTSATSSTTDDFKVTIINPARIYDSNGKKTAFTANKGTFRTVTGSKVINGAKYYKIGDNSYILASDTEKGIDNSVPNHFGEPEAPDKPTDKEWQHILHRYATEPDYDQIIYFSDSELAQIKNYLWQDIQNYRVEQGLPAYKTNVELDSLISKICASSDKMWDYEQDLAGATKITLAPYLPTMNANGMDMTDTWIEDNYYGRRIVGEITPKEFNFKDRNPEHVATQIFNSCKADKYYNKMILGHNDKAAFAGLGLVSHWGGNYSYVGIAFIEVSGNSAKWLSFYNAN
ncbi:hypothetical protein F5ESL0236_07780 [Lactobacillus sp. ESL0236]|uniref:SLAP domain-containing protein n=1 Tax=unclassified Lactobacillus TaxID=2620435 RepID=UPI000EFD0DCF|nr:MULTISPECIES: SLAP domain-containing protein [unclassified Lactobacillus]RMC38124.1 hypothetical protein F5ESL0237_07755 [Lactobacillus sp. ESL0237]RMC42665.1 hypothetical protein F5ESL0234_07700 [Lactobacillus sp. ESL0234]RMC43352.1 hypothetical protein F5ESL0236_07780 [Lactobacillus sp. ESL0236]